MINYVFSYKVIEGFINIEKIVFYFFIILLCLIGVNVLKILLFLGWRHIFLIYHI